MVSPLLNEIDVSFVRDNRERLFQHDDKVIFSPIHGELRPSVIRLPSESPSWATLKNPNNVHEKP